MHSASSGGRLTIVGLGIGSWEGLTHDAATTIERAAVIHVRSSRHPSLDGVRSRFPGLQINSFDSLYEEMTEIEHVHDRIVHELSARVEAGEDVVYAVPGSPSVHEATVHLLLQRFRDEAVSVRIVQGISFVEPVLAAVGAAPGWLELLDASEVALLSRENAVGEVEGRTKPLPWRAPVPTAALVIHQIHDHDTASGVRRWLGRFYPDHHQVCLIRLQGAAPPLTGVPLCEIDRHPDIDDGTVVYIPPVDEMDNVRTFAGLMQLTRRLRGPGGCPWDREQTHDTLKPHLLEETYEVLDALDSGQPPLIAEELGDLLFQVTIHAQVAAEAGEFTIEDVIESIMRKLIGRHPHVFGDLDLGDAQDVRRHWESFKQREKPKRTSVLEQIPHGLPALPQSNLMQKRAAGVGFEWPSLALVLDKVREELDELQHEVDVHADKGEQREEFGDILFALVSVARHLRIDPEEALRLANRKFAARFQYVEGRVGALGKSLRDLSPEELDIYWEEAKALGTSRHV